MLFVHSIIDVATSRHSDTASYASVPPDCCAVTASLARDGWSNSRKSRWPAARLSFGPQHAAEPAELRPLESSASARRTFARDERRKEEGMSPHAVPVMALRRRMESMLKAHPHAGCMSCPFIFNASCVLADAAAHPKPQVDSSSAAFAGAGRILL